MPLHEQGKKLLQQVAEQIVRHPEHFDMLDFMLRRHDGNTDPVHVNLIQSRDVRIDLTEPGCSGCIGGWAVALAHQQGLIPKERYYNRQGWIDELAMEVLGLNYREAEQVFFVEGWPRLFKDAYAACKTDGDRAVVAAHLIAYHINQQENTHGTQCNTTQADRAALTGIGAIGHTTACIGADVYESNA